jgi:hypothetical protein
MATFDRHERESEMDRTIARPGFLQLALVILVSTLPLLPSQAMRCSEILSKEAQALPFSFGEDFQSKSAKTEWQGLRQKMTYDQFRELIHLKMSEVRVFGDVKLFEWKAFANLATDFHIFGGAVRGLILWIRDSAESKTYEEILALRPPELNSLISKAGGADYDFILFGHGKKLDPKDLMALKLNLKLYDMFYPEFYQGSVEAGGPALDKVAIGRNRILDPYGALRSIYQFGRVEFIYKKGKLFEHYEFKDNHRIALFLKHLRLLSTLQVEITDRDLRFFKEFVQNQVKLGIPKNNFFITKTLAKVKNDPSLTSLMEAIGLTSALKLAGYFDTKD